MVATARNSVFGGPRNIPSIRWASLFSTNEELAELQTARPTLYEAPRRGEIARLYGIGEPVGDVLRENAPMLAMCRELGFAITADPNDTTLSASAKRRPELGLGLGMAAPIGASRWGQR